MEVYGIRGSANKYSFTNKLAWFWYDLNFIISLEANIVTLSLWWEISWSLFVLCTFFSTHLFYEYKIEPRCQKNKSQRWTQLFLWKMTYMFRITKLPQKLNTWRKRNITNQKYVNCVTNRQMPLSYWLRLSYAQSKNIHWRKEEMQVIWWWDIPCRKGHHDHRIEVHIRSQINITNESDPNPKSVLKR
jgi:hypothetical protein